MHLQKGAPVSPSHSGLVGLLLLASLSIAFAQEVSGAHRHPSGYIEFRHDVPTESCWNETTAETDSQDLNSREIPGSTGNRRITLENGVDWQAEQVRDRVQALPGQPPVSFAMYSGYVTVNTTRGRALFYYFTEAASTPETKPLVFWYNGGPGCSSLAFGFAEELGPFRIHPNGTGLYLNPYSANHAANVVFVESPAGVGFSYTNHTKDLPLTGDKQTAIDNYAFLVNWFKKFPEYKARDFYLMGESYAGYYVPELAKLVYETNKKLESSEKLHFKGYMVGNPVIDYYYDNVGTVDYYWTHAMISDETYAHLQAICNWTDFVHGPSNKCIQLLYYDAPDKEFGNIDQYSIFTPACTVSPNGSAHRLGQHSRRNVDTANPLRRVLRAAFDPCSENYAEIYFNRPDVQKALHANTTGIPYRWTGCSDLLFNNWTDQPETVLPIYRELIAAGLKIWVYSGDADSVVPVTATRYSLKDLKLPIKHSWYAWYHHQQVGGRSVVYDGLTFVTMRGAGHEVPLLQRSRYLQLVEHFLSGERLPPKAYN